MITDMKRINLSFKHLREISANIIKCPLIHWLFLIYEGVVLSELLNELPCRRTALVYLMKYVKPNQRGRIGVARGRVGMDAAILVFVKISMFQGTTPLADFVHKILVRSISRSKT